MRVVVSPAEQRRGPWYLNRLFHPMAEARIVVEPTVQHEEGGPIRNARHIGVRCRDRRADDAIGVAPRDERSLGNFVGEVDPSAGFLAGVDRIVGTDGMKVEPKFVNLVLSLAFVVQSDPQLDNPEAVLLSEE